MAATSAAEVAASPGHRFDVFFKGSYGDGRRMCGDLNVDSCSAGIRPWIKGYLQAANSLAPHRVAMAATATMESTFFALAPAGMGCWSTRLFDAIDRLAVPVILANGAVQPFESLLDYGTFSLRVDTGPLLSAPLAAGAASCSRSSGVEGSAQAFLASQLNGNRSIIGVCPLDDDAATLAGAAAAAFVLGSALSVNAVVNTSANGERGDSNLSGDHEEPAQDTIQSDAEAIRASQGLALWTSLHESPDAVRRVCRPTPERDPEMVEGDSAALNAKEGSSSRLTAACEALPLVKKIRRLSEVRKFFLYNPTRRQSAWGAFLVELQQRKVQRG